MSEEETYLSWKQGAYLVAGLWDAEPNQLLADYRKAVGAPGPFRSMRECDGCEVDAEFHWHGTPA